MNSPSQTPVISVLIPAYNHEKYIRGTIESVLGQTYRDLEVVVINDGSTDGTDSAIREYKDSRVVYISRENRGAHNTINQAIALAQGEYVSILNSDDVYEADRLEKCLAYLQETRIVLLS